MRMRKNMKRTMACALSLAMAVTMVPAQPAAGAEAKSFEADKAVDDGLIAKFTFDDAATGLTGAGATATANGGVTLTDEAVMGKAAYFNGSNGYYDVKTTEGGSLLTGLDEITISYFSKPTTATEGKSWTFYAAPSAEAPSYPNEKYLAILDRTSNIAIQRFKNSGKRPEGINVSGDYSEWKLVTVTADASKCTLYVNGEKLDEHASEYKISDILLDSSILQIGKANWKDGEYYEGYIDEYSIYNRILTEDEIQAIYSEGATALETKKVNDQVKYVEENLASMILNKNTSVDVVANDLTFPAKSGDLALSWSTSDASIISETGKVTFDGQEPVEVTVFVKGTYKGEEVLDTSIVVTVTNKLSTDASLLEIPSVDNIKGNITLPTEGANGSTITWKSSNENVISTKAIGKMAPGVVKRQPLDTRVTLTATISADGKSINKTFDCTVKRTPAQVETTDYLFAYFPYADTKDERIYFATSEDGLVFDALNNGKYVIESKLGTHGLRDPFVIRSKEGDKFYMVATDLTVAGLTQDGVNYPGMGWADNQRIGSKYIMVWESDDLVNWTNQRACKVADDAAGCTWAPEAYYDDATGQYLVFWASMIDGKHCVWCSTTRDFVTFTKAEKWIEENGSVIDTTVIKVGEYYYRYTKNEAGSANRYGTPSKRVYCERSKDLLSKNWELVNKNCLKWGNGQIEGPSIMKVNSDDVDRFKAVADEKGIDLGGNELFCLTADATGVTIFPGVTDDIATGDFGIIATKATETIDGEVVVDMPAPAASHGTILPITAEEYNRLRIAYDSEYKELVQDADEEVAAAAEKLDVKVSSTTVSLPKTVDGATVTWKSSNPAVIGTDGTIKAATTDTVVTLTATITVPCDVREQVRTKEFVITVKGVPTPVKPVVKPLAVGTVEKIDKVAYTVTNSDVASPEVAFASTNKKASKVTIPATVTIKGVTYKVTGIANNAFKGNTKLKSITIPAGITTIGKSAFNGCKNLKKITIKSTAITKVGSSAFKKINAKATIKVPKAKKKAYTKLFKKKGQAKTVKIK